MKKKTVKSAAAVGLCLTVLAGGVCASAAYRNLDAALPQGGDMAAPDCGRMVISEAGEYTLRGDMRGTVLVDPGAGDVKLVLDGARLDGGSGPAIMAVSGDRLDIELAEGSLNGMTGRPCERPGGMICSDIPVSFEGKGRLDMTGGGQNAIFVRDNDFSFNGADVRMPEGPAMPGDNQQSGQMPAMPGGEQQSGSGMIQSSADTAGEIVTGVTENSAMALEADYENATTYDVSEESVVKITDSGTYIVTGTASEGSITVKKGAAGVVLILEDLDLTSTSGATLSINKNAEVQVIISGSVTLTDNENPDDEYSADEEVADAYDGAAIKVKAGSVAFITGDGALTINGNAKNGIKAGDDSSLIIGGDVTIDISAVNDGINGNYDVTILSGDVTVSAGDDGIHADRILTIGEDGDGPSLTITDSNEGLEGTVVNIAGGTVSVKAADDGINAANADGVYEGELAYSVNITGGDVTVTTSADGIDSNGNVNLIGGSASIRSAAGGGEAGIDYDGELYVSDSFRLNNQSGVAGPDGMGGAPGQMGGAPGDMGGFGGGPNGNQGGMPGNMGGGFRP